MNELKNWIEKQLSNYNVLETMVPYITMFILFVTTVFVVFFLRELTRQVLLRVVGNIIRKTPTHWDDLLIKHKLFPAIASLVSVIILTMAVPVIFGDFQTLLPFFVKLVKVYFLYVILRIIMVFLNGSEEYFSASPIFMDKPIASYFQLIRLLLYITVFILALSILLGESPLYYLGAFGAFTAVLLLIFKDTILGLVASVQIATNDMIRVGDWVEMPKYNADGDVLAINLNTVKVVNWDKTITTVPTHYFISDSFKNWRGMQESGGRRIKRTIHINTSSVRFVDEAMRESFKKFYLINEFISNRQKEIEEYNASHAFDTSALINGRRMTNIGVFRNYIQAYLINHPGINQNMTLLVRQLESTQFGLPIEVYCFTKSVKWAEHEEAQSDIFDHLFAAASYFHLEVFQSPSGADFSRTFENIKNDVADELN